MYVKIYNIFLNNISDQTHEVINVATHEPFMSSVNTLNVEEPVIIANIPSPNQDSIEIYDDNGDQIYENHLRIMAPPETNYSLNHLSEEELAKILSGTRAAPNKKNSEKKAKYRSFCKWLRRLEVIQEESIDTTTSAEPHEMKFDIPDRQNSDYKVSLIVQFHKNPPKNCVHNIPIDQCNDAECDSKNTKNKSTKKKSASYKIRIIERE